MPRVVPSKGVCPPEDVTAQCGVSLDGPLASHTLVRHTLVESPQKPGCAAKTLTIIRRAMSGVIKLQKRIRRPGDPDDAALEPGHGGFGYEGPAHHFGREDVE